MLCKTFFVCARFSIAKPNALGYSWSVNGTLYREAWVELLERMRREYRAYSVNREAQRGYATAALAVVSTLEAHAPESELWSLPGVAESELSKSSRLGDHIAVTRSLLGLIP
jgi:hypothetical protein